MQYVACDANNVTLLCMGLYERAVFIKVHVDYAILSIVVRVIQQIVRVGRVVFSIVAEVDIVLFQIPFRKQPRAPVLVRLHHQLIKWGEFHIAPSHIFAG